MGGGLSLQQGALVSKAELRGHTSNVCGDVNGVACFTLPDGSPRAISACSDRTLRVWDCPDGLVEAVRASSTHARVRTPQAPMDSQELPHAARSMLDGLSDDEFAFRVGCSREEFAQMKPWKQRQLVNLGQSMAERERDISAGDEATQAAAHPQGAVQVMPPTAPPPVAEPLQLIADDRLTLAGVDMVIAYMKEPPYRTLDTAAAHGYGRTAKSFVPGRGFADMYENASGGPCIGHSDSIVSYETEDEFRRYLIRKCGPDCDGHADELPLRDVMQNFLCANPDYFGEEAAAAALCALRRRHDR